MLRLRWITFPVVAALLIPALAVTAQEQPPAAPAAGGGEPALLAQVRQAYREAQQYQATVTFEVEQQSGRVTNIQRMEIYVAYDRPQQRLVVDKPDMRIVVGEGKLNMSSDQIPGHYLAASVADPLQWRSMSDALPFIAQPAMPDAVLLTAEDPAAELASPGAQVRAGDEPNTLIVPTEDGPMTLYVNGQTGLIERAVLAVETGSGGPSITLRYDYDVRRYNEPIDAATFAFDTQNGQGSATLQELMTAVQAGMGNAGGAGGGQGQGGGHALEGQPAPPIVTVTSQGEDFDLSQLDAEVVVLDFWATWCGPCREGLPLVQQVSDWAQQAGKPVAVYTVNVQETPAQANAFWQQQNFTMPILMDGDGAISEAYGVQGIPQTVVIAHGRVEAVHVGYTPALADELKAEIEAALSHGHGEAATN